MVTYLWMPTVSLAFGYAQLRDEHIRVTLLLENASSRVKKTFSILSEIIVLLLVLWIASIALDGAQTSFAVNERVATRPWLPIWLSHYVVTAAYVLFVLGAMHRLVNVWSGAAAPFRSETTVEGDVL